MPKSPNEYTAQSLVEMSEEEALEVLRSLPEAEALALWDDLRALDKARYGRLKGTSLAQNLNRNVMAENDNKD